MYKIKQMPEDFFVKEISSLRLDPNGQYSYFVLKKKNYNTLRAIEKIAASLNISPKRIGFAGNKDKNAVTQQIISIKDGKKDFDKLKLKDIQLEHLGKGNEEIYIGSLKGNEFAVTIRNLTRKEIKNFEEKIKEGILMPNYFGAQRFSKNNILIGKAIIQKNFSETIDLILESNSDFNESIKLHLKSRKNDFVGALKIIPLKLLKLYIHSYQSYLFNETLGQYIKSAKNSNLHIKNKKIPIIGFSTELAKDGIGKLAEKIMKDEKIAARDFIVRAIPDLSSEGSEREIFIKIKDFKIIKKDKDELNENNQKLVAHFSLPKGCYATVLIDFLFKIDR